MLRFYGCNIHFLYVKKYRKVHTDTLRYQLHTSVINYTSQVQCLQLKHATEVLKKLKAKRYTLKSIKFIQAPLDILKVATTGSGFLLIKWIVPLMILSPFTAYSKAFVACLNYFQLSRSRT